MAIREMNQKAGRSVSIRTRRSIALRDPRSHLRVATVAAGTALHVVLFLGAGFGGGAGEAVRDLRIFVGLSAAFSLLPLAVWNHRGIVAATIGRLILFLMVAVPLIERPVTAQLVLVAMIADAACHLPFAMNAVAALVVLVAGGFGIVAQGSGSSFAAPSVDVTGVLTLPVLVAALGVAVRRLIEQLEAKDRQVQTLNDAVLQLTTANSGFLRYASVAQKESAQEERKRITRDLHDIIGQSLTDIISMMNAVIRHPVESGVEIEKLHRWVRNHAQECLRETRGVLYRLRAMREGELNANEAIRNLVETFERSTNVRVTVEWANSPVDYGGRVNVVLYRAIQEALVNAFRHGRATAVRIYFWLSEEDLRVTIEDNGRGSADAKMGIGQLGMQERVGAIGGSVSFGNTVEGYGVTVRIPRAMVRSRDVADGAPG